MKVEKIELMKFGVKVFLVKRTAHGCENWFVLTPEEAEEGKEGHWIGGK